MRAAVMRALHAPLAIEAIQISKPESSTLDTLTAATETAASARAIGFADRKYWRSCSQEISVR